MQGNNYYKENCFALAVRHDNLEMVKKLITLAEEYNSEDNVVIDVFAPNADSVTAIGLGINSKNMEMVKLLSSAKWDNGKTVNDVIKFYFETDDKDASDEQDLSFFKSLFSTVKNLSDIQWLNVFTWCINCKKVNKPKYIEFILQLNIKHNGRLFDCDNTWKMIMKLNDYQILSTLFSSSGSNKLIPTEYEFSSIKSNIKYWKLLTTFASQTISDNKANEAKIKSFELLLKQKEFISLFKRDFFGEDGNDLVMSLLGTLTTRDMPKWINYFVKEIASTKLDVNKMKYTDGTIYNCLFNSITYGRFEVFKEIHNVGWYGANLDEENSKFPLIAHAIRSTRGFDKSQPLESQNFKIFQILLQDKNTNLLFEHPRYKWDSVGLCQMHKPQFIPFMKKRLQQMDGKKWSSAAMDNTIKKYELAKSIINAAKKSDCDRLKGILDENKDSEIADCINVVINYETALSACIKSDDGFEDDNQMQGENYKCFKLLISIKGIDINAGGFDLAVFCVTKNKVAILEYLVNKMDMSCDGNPHVGSNRSVFENCANGNLQMFKYLLKINEDTLHLFDWNRILYNCASSHFKFSANTQRTCDNFLTFETIVNKCHEYLDINGYTPTMRHYSGYSSIIGALAYYSKYEYIEFLEEINDKMKLGIEWNRFFRSSNVCCVF